MPESKLKAGITAVGKYLPSNKLTNKELEKIVDTSDEWIKARTGIHQRRIVSSDEASSHMCIKAFKCLEKTFYVNPSEIDAIIVGTVTPDMLFPSTACLIQNKINAKNAWGFDLSAACSGFLFALETGIRMIESNQYTKILVFGVDTMSSIIDYQDRNTCILFGDGAGVVLLEPVIDGTGIIDSKMKIDGSGKQFLNMKAGGSLMPASQNTINQKLHYVYQDGKTVFKHAVKGMADISYEIASRNHLKANDIDLFVPHQANKRIIDAAGKRLGISKEKIFVNIDKYANTTAATIPIALAEASEKNILKKHDNVILSAFGAGFTWGATYLKWSID